MPGPTIATPEILFNFYCLFGRSRELSAGANAAFRVGKPLSTQKTTVHIGFERRLRAESTSTMDHRWQPAVVRQSVANHSSTGTGRRGRRVPACRMHLTRRCYYFALLMIAVSGCLPPSVPTRPVERLPIIELQINNSASQSDDYIAPGVTTPSRIRIVNEGAIESDVQVRLDNMDVTVGGQVRFGVGGGPSQLILDVTLSEDGAWFDFVVTGVAGQLSQRDKDAVIQVTESRVDGVVLARKSLMVMSSVPPLAGPPRIEIQISPVGQNVATIDDYLTWAPVRARIRLVNDSVFTSNLLVRVSNMTPITNGRLVFDDAIGQSPPNTTAEQSTIDLTLPASGGWVGFVVAGEFGQPSSRDKDAVIEVRSVATGQVLGREGVMVRVRKNANTLATHERDRFLEAVAALNMTFDNYEVHTVIHAWAVGLTSASTHRDPAHGGAAFLPWHRVFLLRLERELQAVDPSVAWPYWRFDEPAPNVFNAGFIGAAPSAGGLATFDPGNPLATWSIAGFSGIPRTPNFGPSQIPFGIRTQVQTLSLGSTFRFFRQMQGNPHGTAHCRAAGGCNGLSWIGQLTWSPRDPLFFLLHANIDRLWARWQWTETELLSGVNRYDPTDISSYDLQGIYPGGATTTGPLGHYADDTMWPWDGISGEVDPADPRTWRPPINLGGPFPQTIGRALSPGPQPRPGDVIDYESSTWNYSGLGFCYDDVPFKS